MAALKLCMQRRGPKCTLDDMRNMLQVLSLVHQRQELLNFSKSYASCIDSTVFTRLGMQAASCACNIHLLESNVQMSVFERLHSTRSKES